MLSTLESKIMFAIYNSAKDKPSILITPLDLIKICGQDKLSISILDKIIEELSMDGYFDLVYSDRHGETVYCISLTEKGKAFNRTVKINKRNLLFRLFITVVFAFISFIIGLILKAIF